MMIGSSIAATTTARTTMLRCMTKGGCCRCGSCWNKTATLMMRTNATTTTKTGNTTRMMSSSSSTAMRAMSTLSGSTIFSNTFATATTLTTTSSSTPHRFFSSSSSSTTLPDGIAKTLAGLEGRHFLSILDLSTEELLALLQLSQFYQTSFRGGNKRASSSSMPRPLIGDSIAMIFQKRSTRTRVSTETGMSLLGGHALFLGPSDIQLGVNESMRDTALVLSRFNSLLLARVYAHSDVLELSQQASVPVINALSDLHHPLQTLADLLTLQQHFGGPDKLAGKTLAWVGDGNNVLHDLMLGSVKLGMNVQIATPKGYEPNADLLQQAHQLAHEHGCRVTTTTVAHEAVQNAHVVVTDTWVSMGQEEEYAKRVAEFEGYQVTLPLLQQYASPDVVFLHCLPRHAEEVADDVFYHPKISLVFPEAENRMWTVMAVMAALLGKLA